MMEMEREIEREERHMKAKEREGSPKTGNKENSMNDNSMK